VVRQAGLRGAAGIGQIAHAALTIPEVDQDSKACFITEGVKHPRRRAQIDALESSRHRIHVREYIKNI
jgi:hypothetical protein